jgi:urea transport system substrate-binding protein
MLPAIELKGEIMSTALFRWLSAAAAVLAIFGSGANSASAEDTIKIGILHSLSGTMAISETILKDLMLMEVAEVNAKGGLLGKKI